MLILSTLSHVRALYIFRIEFIYAPCFTEDVTPSNVTLTTATVSWVIPSFLFQEDYIIEYGTDPRNLNMATDPIPSPSNTSLTNVMFSTTLSGLNDSTVYYLRVAAVYNEVFTRYSEQAYLRTKEPGKRTTSACIAVDLIYSCRANDLSSIL